MLRRTKASPLAAPRPPPAPALGPPQFEPAPEAAHAGEFVGQDQDAERDHPEAEHGQEAEHAEDDQPDADGDAQPTRARHGELAPHHRDAPLPVPCLAVFCLAILGHHDSAAKIPRGRPRGNGTYEMRNAQRPYRPQ